MTDPSCLSRADLWRVVSGPTAEHLDRSRPLWLAGSSREFAVSISNVPGPRAPVSVTGRTVANLFSSSEPALHHALRISAISCADEIGIGLCADPTALPGIADLAARIDASYLALRDAALGSPPDVV